MAAYIIEDNPKQLLREISYVNFKDLQQSSLPYRMQTQTKAAAAG